MVIAVRKTAECTKTCAERAIERQSGREDRLTCSRANRDTRVGCGGKERPAELIGARGHEVASPLGGAEPAGSKAIGVSEGVGYGHIQTAGQGVFGANGKIGNPGIAEAGIHVGIGRRTTLGIGAKLVHTERQTGRKQVGRAALRHAARAGEAKEGSVFRATETGKENRGILRVVESPGGADDRRMSRAGHIPSQADARTPLPEIVGNTLRDGRNLGSGALANVDDLPWKWRLRLGILCPVPPKSVGQSDTRGYLPFILPVKANPRLVGREKRVANENVFSIQAETFDETKRTGIVEIGQ